MKIFFSFLLLFSLQALHAQQKKFLDVGHKSLKAPVFPESFESLFKDSLLTETSITIWAEELTHAKEYDLSKFAELETVQVQLSFSPDSSDAAKRAYIAQVNTYMKNMSAFAQCPKLKNVVFKVGEQIYLTRAECEAINGPLGEHYQRGWKKRSELNLAHAWTAFGADVQLLLPGKKIYGFTWNW